MKKYLFALFAALLATVSYAQDGYRIQSGDVLSIEVLEDPSLNRQALVTPGGTVSFPFVGTLRASGLTTDQLGDALASGLAPNFASSPNVFVAVQSLAPRASGSSSASTATIDIFILGEVNSPGPVQLERGTTLLQALATSGGFTRFAATKRIQLRRRNPSTGQSTVAVINFKALEQGGAFQDITLADGDVILAPERRLFE